jgi:hypothetical protein
MTYEMHLTSDIEKRKEGKKAEAEQGVKLGQDKADRDVLMLQ